jgi:hypothetical protein
MENGMKPQVNKNINVFEQPSEREISHKRTMIFKQLRTLRWPDLPTLLGLLFDKPMKW